MTIKAPLAILTLASFLISSCLGPICPIACSAEVEEFHLPVPGVMVHLSPPLDPPMLKGIKVHPDNPFRFDFILDKGDSELSNSQLKDESSKLIKYFLASLTIPERDLWVNLSPYEKDRIIPNSFGLTEMGRDLLAEDYMLKQITASLIYPEDEVGKKFWKRVYEEAQKRFGTTNIPVNTFNKVWIIPEKAVVYENAKAGTAYVVESKLKVMLEQDYLALSHNVIIAKSRIQDTSALGSQIVREIVIPELNREVNEDKNFSHLRQVYNSLILATWYKKKIKDSILEQVYADRKKVAGVGYQDQTNVQFIYQRYLKAFKKGVYNYIKEDIDPATQETVPRKYFSGGLDFLGIGNTTVNSGRIVRYVNQIPAAAMLSSLTKSVILSVMIAAASFTSLKAAENPPQTKTLSQPNLSKEDRLVLEDTKELVKAFIREDIHVHTQTDRLDRDYLEIAIKQQADQGNEYAKQLMANPEMANRVIGAFLELVNITKTSSGAIFTKDLAEMLRLLMGVDEQQVIEALKAYAELIIDGNVININALPSDKSIKPNELRRYSALQKFISSDEGKLLLWVKFQGVMQMRMSFASNNVVPAVEQLLRDIKSQDNPSSIKGDAEQVQKILDMSKGYADLLAGRARTLDLFSGITGEARQDILLKYQTGAKMAGQLKYQGDVNFGLNEKQVQGLTKEDRSKIKETLSAELTVLKDSPYREEARNSLINFLKNNQNSNSPESIATEYLLHEMYPAEKGFSEIKAMINDPEARAKEIFKSIFNDKAQSTSPAMNADNNAKLNQDMKEKSMVEGSVSYQLKVPFRTKALQMIFRVLRSRGTLSRKLAAFIIDQQHVPYLENDSRLEGVLLSAYKDKLYQVNKVFYPAVRFDFVPLFAQADVRNIVGVDLLTEGLSLRQLLDESLVRIIMMDAKSIEWKEDKFKNLQRIKISFEFRGVQRSLTIYKGDVLGVNPDDIEEFGQGFRNFFASLTSNELHNYF